MLICVKAADMMLNTNKCEVFKTQLKFWDT